MAVQVQADSYAQFEGLHTNFQQQLDSLVQQRDALNAQIAAMEPLVADSAAILADLEVAP